MGYTLITGACGGLGRAFVWTLAARGESLFLTGRSQERLLELATEIRSQYPSVEIKCFPCDLTNSHSRRALFAFADENKLVFSRLIYVAGADIQKSFEKYTEEKLVFQARVNFEGAVSCMRAVFERAPHDGNTEILTIGSVSGIYPMPYFALYSATKKAIEQFSSAVRTEWKGRAKVTCVLPGAIPTRDDIKANIKTQGVWGRLAPLSPETVVRRSLKAVKRNRRKVILGGWNKLMRIFTALIPMRVKLKLIARRWKKTEKDAF